jgi:tRNA-Thr(GGU) m(6)t(6)A37 methyltransferase TsaA
MLAFRSGRRYAVVMEATLRPIGWVRSPFKAQPGTPIQPRFSDGERGTVTLEPGFGEALCDLDGFERIWLVWLADRARPYRSKVVPYRDVVERGVLATRSPSRPNPIGLSVVRLVEVRGSELEVLDVDLLDWTPVLDIKPYVPMFDAFPESAAGWLADEAVQRRRADERFEE